MKQLSVIILTHSQCSVLAHCLQSLMPAIQGIDAEVIVVDNASADGTDKMLAEHYPEVRVLCNDINRGVAAARNQGIKASCGEYILILDNDTVVNADAIHGMLQYICATPTAGIVTCRLLNADHSVQESMKPYPGLRNKISNVLGIKSVQNFPADADGTVHPVYVIGACQMFSRQLVEEIGLLDENIFYGPEDADFCIRAVAAGRSVCYLPQFAIEHLHRHLTRGNLFSPLARKHAIALLYFYRKHRRWW